MEETVNNLLTGGRAASQCVRRLVYIRYAIGYRSVSLPHNRRGVIGLPLRGRAIRVLAGLYSLHHWDLLGIVTMQP